MIRVLPTEPARYLPTAQPLLADVVVTLARLGSCPGLGFGTCFQARPFQRTTMVFWLVPVLYVPTAQALLAEEAATPLRVISVTGPAGLGLAICAQFVPFQRRIRVLLPVLVKEPPAAQALPAEVAVTASSALPVPGAGLATWDHAVPFQRRISVFCWKPESENSPTA